MPDLNAQYERKLLAQHKRRAMQLRALFDEAIQDITLAAAKVTYQGQVFSLSKYPQLKARIDAAIKRMHGEIYAGVVDGIEASWGMSNEKNSILVDKRVNSGKLKGKTLPDKWKRILYDPNDQARQAFLTRKEKGLDLSERVWNSLEPFKQQLEMGLGAGISEGKPAAAMARDLRAALNDPDRLFRRVRNAKGNLKLSKAAQAYKPGQGVYRSSYKNALRLTRTETNMAYRKADFERWQQLPFVRGILVKLSDAHPRYDICDRLAGEYPPDFVFVGWHPQCLCHAVPMMISDDEYEKLEDQILGISDEGPKVAPVATPHKEFAAYVEENRDRIKGWKNTPYWIRDNKQHVQL
jgi:hypothetical protein